MPRANNAAGKSARPADRQRCRSFAADTQCTSGVVTRRRGDGKHKRKPRDPRSSELAPTGIVRLNTTEPEPHAGADQEF